MRTETSAGTGRGTTTDLPPPARPREQPCPRLGPLPCQRRDPHGAGHVYHAAWAPDRHDEAP